MLRDRQRLICELKVADLAEYYERRGYHVQENAIVEGFRPDLVVKGQEQTIVIEVKTSEMLRKSKDEVKRHAALVHTKPGFRYDLVLASGPRPKEIEIDGIETTLLGLLLKESPSGLDTLASRAHVEEITDVEVTYVRLTGHQVEVKGNATVSVVLQYGSDRDQDNEGLPVKSFPLSFFVALDWDLNIAEVHRLEVDTLTYYE